MKFLVLSLLFIFSSHLYAGDKKEKITTIQMKDFQKKELHKYGSIKDIEFGGPNIVWMIDDKNLWRWNFLTATLKRITFGENLSSTLRKLVLKGRSLLIFADRTIYSLDIETLRIKRINSPSKGTIGPLYVDDESLAWVDGQAAWSYRFADKTFKREAKLDGLRQTDIAYYSKNSGNTLFSRGPYIFLKKSRSKQPQLLHRDTADFTSAFVDKNENIFFISQNVVMRYSPSAELLQAIPATNKSAISFARIDDRYHSYLLEDGRSLEVFDLEKKSRKLYSLDKLQAVTAMRIKPRFVSLLSGGFPVVYHIKSL